MIKHLRFGLLVAVELDEVLLSFLVFLSSLSVYAILFLLLCIGKAVILLKKIEFMLDFRKSLEVALDFRAFEEIGLQLLFHTLVVK